MRGSLCIGLLAGLLSGCLNVTTQILSPDMDVKPARVGSDCVYQILLPIMVGTVTADQARKNAGHYEPNPGYEDKFVREPITRVHSIAVRDWAVPFYGEHCIEVTGE